MGILPKESEEINKLLNNPPPSNKLKKMNKIKITKMMMIMIIITIMIKMIMKIKLSKTLENN